MKLKKYDMTRVTLQPQSRFEYDRLKKHSSINDAK